MTRLLIIFSLALCAGCGSSGSTPLFDDFTPTGGSALVFAPTTCDISFVGPSAVSAIALDFTSYADSCGVITQTQLCGTKASSVRALGLVVNGEVGATTIDPVGPGTYPFLPDPPTGVFQAATGAAVKNNTECEALPGGSTNMTSGSITITSVTAATVTGTTNMRFDNGQTYARPFELTVCPATIDLCSRFLPCGNHTCVP